MGLVSKSHAAYDANGNTLSDAQGRSFTWDFENRLTQVVNPGVGTTTFRYDPFGRRIQKSGPLGTTNYLYDGWNLLEEVDASGNGLARYTQSTDIDEPLSELRGGTTSYYQEDALGSVTSLSNGAGTVANTYTYDSFGKLTASSGMLANPFQFTGREFDSDLGIYEYRARYFDQATGRFISADPMRFHAGINFYAYVHNSPLNAIDPLGLAECVYSISQHTIVCNSSHAPALVGPNWGTMVVGPDGVFSGLDECKNKTSCEWNRNKGPIPPGRYRMNYYWDKQSDGHDRFRLEPWPSDFWSRVGRDLQHSRFHGLGVQLHRGHYSEGCINVLQDNPGAMEQYDEMMNLLMSEDGSNFLTVTE